MLKNFLSSKFTFFIILKLINYLDYFIQFLFFEERKVKKKKLIYKKNLNQRHINSNTEAQKINFILHYNDVEMFLSNFCEKYYQDLEFCKILKLNFLNLKKITIYTKVINVINSINKKYQNLSYIFYLIIINNHQSYKPISKYVNNFEKESVDYLNFIFSLKNFSISRKNFKIKENLIKKKIKHYKDFLSLKTMELAVEHSLANYQLLKKIKFMLKKNDGLKKYQKKHHVLGTSLYAYGHLINFIDIFSRIRLNRKTIISPYYVANSCLANYLKLKYPKKVVIDHYEFLKTLDKRNYDTIFANEEFDNHNSISRLPYKEFKKTGCIKPSLNLKIYEVLLKIIKPNLLNIKKKYFVIILRDNKFKKYDRKIKSNNDRYVEISFLHEIIEFMNKCGYYTVILNGYIDVPLNKKNNYFDYPNSKFKNDYNDIYLLKNSEFIMHFGHTASPAIDLLFNKFSLHIDYPLNRKPIFNNKAFYSARPMFKNRKKINIKDYFNNQLYINNDFKVLYDQGYRLGKTNLKETKKIILSFLKKMKTKNYTKTLKYIYPLNILN